MERLSFTNSINDLINTTDIEFVSMQRPFVFNPKFLVNGKTAVKLNHYAGHAITATGKRQLHVI